MWVEAGGDMWVELGWSGSVDVRGRWTEPWMPPMSGLPSDRG